MFFLIKFIRSKSSSPKGKGQNSKRPRVEASWSSLASSVLFLLVAHCGKKWALISKLMVENEPTFIYSAAQIRDHYRHLANSGFEPHLNASTIHIVLFELSI